MPTCESCGFDAPSESCLVVVIDTDTSGTLISRKLDCDARRRESFINRYHQMIDNGQYPNRSKPFVECGACREIRHREIQEELDWYESRRID